MSARVSKGSSVRAFCTAVPKVTGIFEAGFSAIGGGGVGIEGCIEGAAARIGVDTGGVTGSEGITATFGEIGGRTGGTNLKEMPRLSKIVVIFSTNVV
jgi:hypothetical protein